MFSELSKVEQIVQIVTREVLIALAEQEQMNALPEGDHCHEEYVDGICVRTCFDRVGRVVSAGATRITSSLGSVPDDPSVGRYVDHTLLKPDATSDQIAQLCYEARKFEFASVCVNPTHVKLCAELLTGTGYMEHSA